MRAANPAFIPRNHLVEEAISAAVNDGYFPPFESLLTVLSMPTRINRPSAATSIRRDLIKSCTKRFAALDQGGKLDAGLRGFTGEGLFRDHFKRPE